MGILDALLIRNYYPNSRAKSYCYDVPDNFFRIPLIDADTTAGDGSFA